MAAADTTTATTQVPGKPETGGFPPFKTETFPSQIFWLAVTFLFLFVVLWRVAGPRIAGTITTRRNTITGDLTAAQTHRADAESASAAYQAALTSARGKAQGLADANRKAIAAEIEREKQAADAKAHDDIARAEARIAASRIEARSHVAKAAEEATVAIVAHLTGETVSVADAAEAVRMATGS
jgi:F-type H+-transporting ATPase subunit b